MRDIWFSHPPAFRRRVAVLLAIVALFAVYKLATKSGGDGPEGGAIAFVPSDAYAYAHVDLDPSSDQFAQAQDVGARLPHLDSIVKGLVGYDIGSLAGDEASVAELPLRGGAPETLLIAAIGGAGAADGFLVEAAGQPTGEGEYRGEKIAEYAGGMASTEQDGFLLFGPAAAVRAGLDTKAEPNDSLATDETAQEVRGALPGKRFADAYVSRDAYSLISGTELGGALDTFTNFDASKGLAVAAVATPDGFSVQMASDLDPDKVASAPGFLSAFPSFDPSLAALFDSGTLALIQIGDPSKTVTGLLDQAEAVQPGISAAYERLRAQLRREDGFDIADDLIAQLGDEMAVGIAPGKGDPYITAAFDGVDEVQARAAVARLAAPLIGSVNPSRTGQAPSFSQAEVDGTRVVSLQISPATTVSLAAFDGHLVVTTDPDGVKRGIEGDAGLGGDPAYQAVGDVGSGDPSALVFLDLKGLVALGEPIGLTRIRNYDRFRQDFSKLGALGVKVSTDEDEIDTELTLQINQGDQDK